MSLSKELLNEVLNEEVEEIFIFSKNTIGYYIKDNFNGNGKQIEHKINIHELINKCKKWAWGEGYEILERKTQVDIHKNKKRIAQFVGDSLIIFLPNRVYESCEWILEQKAK